MAKEVHLLNYWMPLLRQLKEFKEIANTEEPELRYILSAIDRTLANMFIETADEYGIKRFEDMMRIVPNEGESLDVRRFKVLTKWNDYTPYTDAELYRKLVSICGSEDLIDIEEHYEDYWLKVTTNLGVAGAFDLVADAFREMLPCNLVLELANILEAKKESTLYVGGVCCTAFIYCITHDIEVATGIIDNPVSFGVGNSVGGGNLITHDVHVEGATELELGVGFAAGMATTTLITQDINTTAHENGKHTVATSVNVAKTVKLN